ncbi:FAD-dependent oxidoreductase [Streptomyces niphimycinicus]|uniref:FAD-dependent oxidoreductase n=1 Tax=Streptomyces niphimycinicus TaxID=2842201 RepID=UPI00209A8E64|nr:FAD-dependent oxidoreductase [Streptomyces niphimycinicus]
MAEADAVIVGSGVNGLVAAAELALAGWSVVLVEREPNIGGFIATEERTLPGYLHDTYSSWHPLFVSGPAYARLGEQLRRHPSSSEGIPAFRRGGNPILSPAARSAAGSLRNAPPRPELSQAVSGSRCSP